MCTRSAWPASACVPGLVILRIASCIAPAITNYDLDLLATALSGGTCLRELDMANTFRQDQLDRLLQSLRTQRLNVLCISGNRCQFSNLQALSGLEDLDVSDCLSNPGADVSVRRFGRWLPTLVHLTSLDISFAYMGVEAGVVAGLQSLPSLARLRANSIRTAPFLERAIQEMTSLTFLELGCNDNMGPHMFQYDSKYALRSVKLATLNLSRTHVFHFQEWVLPLVCLRTLDVSNWPDLPRALTPIALLAPCADCDEM